MAMRFPILFSVVVAVLSIAVQCRGQESLTEEFLQQALLTGMESKVDANFLSKRFSTGLNGKTTSGNLVLETGRHSARLIQTGQPSIVRAFNEKYAFVIVNPSGDVNQRDGWQIVRFAEKEKDLVQFQEIEVLAMPNKSSFLTYGNWMDTFNVLDLLKEKAIQIKQQKKLTSGAIQVEFEITPEFQSKIAEYDIEVAKLKELENQKADAGNLPGLPGPRPIEVQSMVCVVEPEFGYLVSSLQLKIGFRDNTFQQWQGNAEGFQRIDSVWYPKVHSYVRTKGEYEETATSEILEFKRSENVAPEATYLAYYGLNEPDGQQSDEQSSQVKLGSNGRVVVGGLFLIVAAVLILTLVMKMKRQRDQTP